MFDAWKDKDPIHVALTGVMAFVGSSWGVYGRNTPGRLPVELNEVLLWFLLLIGLVALGIAFARGGGDDRARPIAVLGFGLGVVAIIVAGKNPDGYLTLMASIMASLIVALAAADTSFLRPG